MTTSPDNTLEAAVRDAAVSKLRPDQTDYLSLSHQAESELSLSQGVSRRDVQLAALKQDISPERYCRNQRGIDFSDQIKLLNSHVAIIGLGGLGGAVTEILCRIGVGELTLVDGDCFDESNLNRQLLSSVSALGKMKAEIAADRVKDVNPAVTTTVVTEYLTSENSADILGSANMAADCLDTITARFTLEAACKAKGIPMVSAAIGGSSGQLTLVMPGDTGLHRIYGDPSRAQKKGVEASIGTPPFTAAAMAAIEASSIVATLTGSTEQLANKLLLADFSHHSLDLMELG